jgi:hypothetical protein
MPTAEKVRDRTLDTIDVARVRAEDLAAVVNRAVGEVRTHAPDLPSLPSVEVPPVDELVHRAASHKVRTALMVSALIVALVLLVRKATDSRDETPPTPG